MAAYMSPVLATLGDLDHSADFINTATALLTPFFAGDPLEVHVPSICAEALDLPAHCCPWPP